MYQLTIKSVKDGKVKDGAALEVDPTSLGGTVRSRLLHAACVMYEARKRVGTHKTKTRGEVSYSNKKPWRQKGTGRARSGTRRSPIWRGGGTVFGPRPRDYRYDMPKKALKRATQSALLSKLRDGEAIVVDALPETGKTRDVAAFLKALGVTGKALLVSAERSEMLQRGSRNLRDAGLMPVSDLNAYDLLYHKRLVITKAALDRALEAFSEASLAGAGAKEEA